MTPTKQRKHDEPAGAPRRAPTVSSWHVIWAWDIHIWAMHAEGNSVAEIRRVLREEHSLHVGEQAIRAVLAAGEPPPVAW